MTSILTVCLAVLASQKSHRLNRVAIEPALWKSPACHLRDLAIKSEGCFLSISLIITIQQINFSVRLYIFLDFVTLMYVDYPYYCLRTILLQSYYAGIALIQDINNSTCNLLLSIKSIRQCSL